MFEFDVIILGGLTEGLKTKEPTESIDEVLTFLNFKIVTEVHSKGSLSCVFILCRFEGTSAIADFYFRYISVCRL